MDHILIDCDVSGQKIIWELVAKLWRKKHNEEITYGKIMGCNLINYRNNEGKPDIGKNRLLKILITESAYLI
jgi:hypothetical protein